MVHNFIKGLCEIQIHVVDMGNKDKKIVWNNSDFVWNRHSCVVEISACAQQDVRKPQLQTCYWSIMK